MPKPREADCMDCGKRCRLDRLLMVGGIGVAMMASQVACAAVNAANDWSGC